MLGGILLLGPAFRAGAVPSDAELAAEIARLGERSLAQREQAFAAILGWGAAQPERVLAALPAEDPDPEVQDACRRLRLCVPHEGLKRRSMAAATGIPSLQNAVRQAFEEPGFLTLIRLCKQGKAHPGITCPILRHFLRHDDWQVRQHAVHQMRDFPDPEALPDVRRLLADPEPPVRAFAVGTLAKLAGTDAFSDLLTCLKDPSCHVRHNTLHALLVLGIPPSAVASLPLLADPECGVRMKAIEVVRRLGGADLAPRVAELLDHREDGVQKAAAGILAHLTGNDWGTDAETARAWWSRRETDDTRPAR